MNFALVLGQLCIDKRFREAFFADDGKNAEELLRSLQLLFSAEERTLLLLISKKGGHSPGLKQDFGQVNDDLLAAAGCGRGPCPIHYFTLNKQPGA
jgi:hypothetical protein